MRLHWLERELILTLKEEKLSVKDVAEKANLSESSVLKASSMLKEKGLLDIDESIQEFLQIDKEGLIYAEKGLPERRLINALIKLGKKATLSKVLKQAGLSKEEGVIAVSWAKRKKWIVLKRERGRIIIQTEKRPSRGNDEKLLDILKLKIVPKPSLSRELLEGYSLLRRRPNVVKTLKKVHRFLALTEEGIKLSRKVRRVEEISQVTPELIRSRKWRKVKFRRFDVTVPGPTIYPGKMHPLEEIIQEVREIFLQMGFIEIKTPLVETAFWNFDVMFEPQDHPARELMATFYLKEPSVGDLPEEPLIESVRRTHENGWITGSIGWRYKWDKKEAKRLLLRTHTTTSTIRYLAKHKEPPVKVFCVDRAYRNEKVDWKHLAEFYQIEGMIMDKDVTIRDLMGILTEFYRKLGLYKVQFHPTYFPFTEPSLQSSVYVSEWNKWVELCGMGMFRPEVLYPLGIKYPVLAWGGGLERIAMIKLGINDMRDFYRNRLSWIRK